MNISLEHNGAEDLCTALFQKLPQAVFILSRQGDVLALNTAATELVMDRLGCQPALPWTFGMMIAVNWPEKQQDIQFATSGDRLALPITTRDDSGTLERFTIVTPLPAPLGQDRRIALVKNTSNLVTEEFSKINRRLQSSDANARLERRKRRALESRFEALQDFSYIAAHDLRTPLSNITQLLDILRAKYGDLLPAEAQRFLDLIQNSSRRLVKLIGDLLDFGLAGTAEIKRQPIDLKQMFQSIFDEMQVQLAQLGGSLDFPKDNRCIEGDPTLVRQLFDNVIGNAVKYRHPQRAPKVSIQVKASDGIVEAITISDNGQGFDQSKAEAIFEPFSRLVHDKSVEGSGVGLATCMRICGRHGWRISATSQIGQGSVFHIQIRP